MFFLFFIHFRQFKQLPFYRFFSVINIAFKILIQNPLTETLPLADLSFAI